jgi:hypothetical protein
MPGLNESAGVFRSMKGQPARVLPFLLFTMRRSAPGCVRASSPQLSRRRCLGGSPERAQAAWLPAAWPNRAVMPASASGNADEYAGRQDGLACPDRRRQAGQESRPSAGFENRPKLGLPPERGQRYAQGKIFQLVLLSQPRRQGKVQAWSLSREFACIGQNCLRHGSGQAFPHGQRCCVLPVTPARLPGRNGGKPTSRRCNFHQEESVEHYR